jgi:ceramide glucosyltransferase
MNTLLLISACYIAQLWTKAGLALSRRRGERSPRLEDRSRVTVIQPVVSGDERLEETLQAGPGELTGCAWIWVVDKTDTEAIRVCHVIRAAMPGRDVLILECEEPPPGTNPKLWKQAAALPFVRTELLAVIDDDTRVPGPSFNLLISLLDDGADLVTGLPCYVPARGPWSRMVAEFVNTAASLTYLPATACAAPVSINGMCYAVRTDYVRRLGLFTTTARCITDDLAIAREIRRHGGSIVQTTRPHFISTTVPSARRYARLLHRWFVFTLILVRHEPPVTAAVITLVFGLPPLLFAAVLVLGVTQPWPGLVVVGAVLVGRALTISAVNRILTGAWRHAPLPSLLTELLQPVFMIFAWAIPVIWWRRRKIRVRGLADFEYLKS